MTNKPDPAYLGDEPYIFVTYSHLDTDIVFEEIRRLQELDFRVWYDEGIGGGSRWRDAIAGRISQCHLLIFFVTPKSVQSQVGREELEYAVDLGKPILCVYLQPTELPEGFRLAMSNRQALYRHELEPEDYERKLLVSVSTYLDRPLSELPASTGVARQWRRKRLLRPILLGSVVALVVIGAFLAFDENRRTRESGAPHVRFNIEPPPGVVVSNRVKKVLDISSHGAFVVFNGTSGGNTQLYMRKLSESQAVAIEGTEGALNFTISPDDRWLAFELGKDDLYLPRIMKIPVEGGVADELLELEEPDEPSPRTSLEMSWGERGEIVFTTNNGLKIVSDSGGEPRQLTQSDPERSHHEMPYFLPDGENLLFVAGETIEEEIQHHVYVVSLATGERRQLVSGISPRFASDHLFFVDRDVVWRVPFNARTTRIEGKPSPSLTDVNIDTNMHYVSHYYLSQDGSLTYLRANSQWIQGLVWYDRSGMSEPIAWAKEPIYAPNLSPDGKLIAYTNSDGEIYLTSPERSTKSKLVEGTWPLFSPDGKDIFFSKDGDIASISLANSSVGVIHESPELSTPNSITDDGRFLVFTQGAFANGDIGLIDFHSESQAKVILDESFSEYGGYVSPDGKWLVYISEEEGEREAFLRPFPGVGGGKWQLSRESDRGLVRDVIWSPDSKEVFYQTRDGDLFSVTLHDDQSLTLGLPKKLFSTQDFGMPELWDIDNQSNRFLMTVFATFLPENRKVSVVTNWVDSQEKARTPE